MSYSGREIEMTAIGNSDDLQVVHGFNGVVLKCTGTATGELLGTYDKSDYFNLSDFTLAADTPEIFSLDNRYGLDAVRVSLTTIGAAATFNVNLGFKS